MTRAIFCLLLITIPASGASAETYYVDGGHQRANDNGSGSTDEPYRTIARGVRGLQPGDQLVIRRGLYRENVEITASGTPGSPVRITGEPGVVIRGTRPVSGFQKAEGHDGVYYAVVSEFRPGRMVETDESRWRPLPVQDPNGVRFDFVRPVLYHRVKSLSLVSRVAGSFWDDPNTQRVYFRTFDGGDPRTQNYGLEAGAEGAGQFRIRARHVVVTSLSFEYARIVQFFEAASVSVGSFDLLATPMQVHSCTDCSIDGLRVENHIDRGDTFEWHHSGSGTAVAITAACANTSFKNVILLRGWNAVSIGGTGTVADNIQIWGFPNHGLGVSGRDNRLSRIRVWNVQDSIYMQGGQNITIQNSHFTEPIHIRDGSSHVKLRNNLYFGSGVFVLENSKAGFDSDYNLFVAPTLDYRIGAVPARSFPDVQRVHQLEMHSLTFTDPGGIVEGWEGRLTQPNVLRLAPGSPAIDSGDPSHPVPPGGGKRIDIGPYEQGALNDAPGVKSPQAPPGPAELRILR